MADKEKKVDDEQQVKKIRMTITSRNVENLEKLTRQIVSKAKDHKDDLQFKGPVRMPTKHLKMVVRKSPCGEGSKTFDRYEMRIHKRVIDLTCTLPIFKEVTSMSISPGVFVELDVSQ